MKVFFFSLASGISMEGSTYNNNNNNNGCPVCGLVYCM